MVIHICEKCGKQFNKKSHYIDHKNRKFICGQNINPIQNNPNNPFLEPILKENSGIFLNKNFRNFEKFDQDNLSEQYDNNDSLYCGYCKKTFVNQSNLNKHIRNNNCKIKREDDETKENIFKLLLEKDKLLEKERKEKEQLKKEMTDLKYQLTELNNNVKELTKKTIQNINNGTINNNINLIIPQNKLNKFGSEKVDLIDNKLFENVINKVGKNIFTECAKNIYANPNNPEYQNIYMSDLSRDKCLTWSGKDWDLTNTNQAMVTVQNQIQKYFNRNKDKYEKLSDPKIKKDFDIRIQKYYNLYYEEFDDQDIEPTKERIEQFQQSVNNDLKKFFFNIRNEVKINHEKIKNNLLIDNVKKLPVEQPVVYETKKTRGRPKKINS